MLTSPTTWEYDMRKMLKKTACNDVGATAIEYGLIAAIVGLGILTAIKSLKTGIDAQYEATTQSLAAAK
jgi:pilus assembly protein Flp/PilA